MSKVALITGITGQDGALLADLLLGKGYTVHGLRLYAATDDMARLDSLRAHPAFHLHYGDLLDSGSLWRLIGSVKPDEIYNLAALSHVGVSFETPEAALQLNTIGTLRLLEALRSLPGANTIRFYQASSSEMFGNAAAPQHEETPFHPCSPYGISKVSAYWLVRNYRDSYGLHASNGILFNHESALRGEEFVTRKITRAVAMIEAGQQDVLQLGNLDALRDWGHAGDYVEGMWRMLQQPMPGDYVLATGQARSVRDFVIAAFACAGVRLQWQGSGLDEKAIDLRSGRTRVSVDPRYFRPTELHSLTGNPMKARRVLGWQPRTSFDALVREMVNSDRASVQASLMAEQGDGSSRLAAE